MRLALAQINTVVGDLAGNRARILERLERGARRAAPTSSSSPSWPSRATRPRICCCGPASCGRPSSRSRRSRASAAGSPRSSAPPTSTATSTTRARCASAARCGRSTASGSCRTTASSTRTRYFAPGRDLLLLEHRRRAARADRSARTSGSRGRPRPSSPSPAPSSSRTSPRHRSTSARSASARRCSKTRARDNACFIAFCNAVGGQDELIFDGHSLVLDDDGEVIARAPGFEECLLVVDVDPVGAVARRLRDVRRRALAAELDPHEVPVVHIGAPREGDRPRVGRADRPDSRRARADAPGAGARARRLRAQERLHGRRRRRLRRHRLGARRPRSRCEALGPEHVHCVSMPSRYSSDETQSDARAARREPGRGLPGAADRARRRGVRPDAGRDVRGPRARPDRGEPPGPRARRPPDGALEQVRLAARCDRQQVGALGRLRDALRRHGRRLRAAQGRVQDGRVPAGAAPQRARGTRAHPAVDDRARAVAPSCAPTSATRTRSRRTPRSTACSRPTSSSTARATSSRQDGFDPDVVERALALVDRAEYKRRQAPPGVKLRPKAFGRDRRVPITNRWPG